MRALNLLLIAVLAVLAVIVYDLKYRTEATEKALASREREIADQEEAIRVLRAEWSYLNQPDRLEALARRYLDLKPITPAELGEVADLPMPPTPDDLYGPYGRQAMGGYAGASAGANGGFY